MKCKSSSYHIDELPIRSRKGNAKVKKGALGGHYRTENPQTALLHPKLRLWRSSLSRRSSALASHITYHFVFARWIQPGAVFQVKEVAIAIHHAHANNVNVLNSQCNEGSNNHRRTQRVAGCKCYTIGPPTGLHQANLIAIYGVRTREDDLPLGEIFGQGYL